jgi:hypothetical protein
LKSQCNTITWLHLSDLHFKRSDVGDRREVLEEFWKDISVHVRNGLRPDFIVVTGDIAYSGHDEEYDLARKHFFKPLLECTDRKKAELFVVPGNHDVDWGKLKDLNIDAVPLLNTREKVNEFLDPGKRCTLFTVMNSYERFIKSYFKEHLADREMPLSPLYGYVDTLRLENGISVALIGLNSAWWSAIALKRAEGKLHSVKNTAGEAGADKGEEKLELTDRGKLLVGQRQVRDALAKAKIADIRIGLMHHPFSWLEEFDARVIRRQLRKPCHFILRGHLRGRMNRFALFRLGPFMKITAKKMATTLFSLIWIKGGAQYISVAFKSITGNGQGIMVQWFLIYQKN